MDRLEAMRAFVAVAEAGSFVGGARSLAVSAPTVTRAVAELEARLGAQLVHRTTRSLSLTEAGLRFLDSTRRLLADLEEAERSAAGAAATPSGHLRLTAPLTFGRSHVMPVLAAFLREQPRIDAALVLLDRVANLVEEGFDLAVRIAELPDSTLVARHLGEVRRLLVASPAYLERRGVPRQPGELAQHEVIGSGFMFSGGEWHFDEQGRSRSVGLASRLVVNDALAAIMAAERGEGIAGALSYMVAPQRAAGELIAVLEEFTPPALPVHLVYPTSRLLAAKVRAFVDFAAPRLARALADAE